MTRWNLDFNFAVDEYQFSYRASWTSGVTTLEGVSGAGKSTLVECLLGIRGHGQLSGKAQVHDTVLFDTEAGASLAEKERPFAWCPQDALLLPYLTVEQNIRMAGGVNEQEPFADIVDALGLSDHLNKKPTQLSGGEKQRVALARALYSAKPVILLDEPLAGVGENQKQRILNHISKALERFPRSVLYVSHYAEDLLQFEGAARLKVRTSEFKRSLEIIS